MRGAGAVLLVLSLSVASIVLAAPYNSPTPDGRVTTEPGDWEPDEWVVDDPADDCRWQLGEADLDDLYVTWDGYALYVGIITVNDPSDYGNGYVLYMDTDAQAGITGATDFTYADFYPRRITLSTMGCDVVLGVWNLDEGSMDVRHCADPTSTTPVGGGIQDMDVGLKHIEIAIPWHGLYGLGEDEECVPAGTTLRFIAAIVGGDNSGAYDAMPNSSTGIESNLSTPWDAYTDLDEYYEALVDTNGDSIPDVHTATPVGHMSWGQLKGVFAE